MDKKGFGKVILFIGIALLLVGIGLGIYTADFSVATYIVPSNMVPTWIANVIAATFIILGIGLIVVGSNELSFNPFSEHDVYSK